MSCGGDLDLERLARGSLHFRRRIVELESGREMSVDAAVWRDAIVFVEEGEVEVECAAGERRRFVAGAVLCLLPPLRVLRNCGGESTRLIAISRRKRPEQPRLAG